MSDKDTERLTERVAELRAEVDRLELLTTGFERTMNETMGKIALRGLVSTLIFAPLLGIVVYLSARLALRERK